MQTTEKPNLATPTLSEANGRIRFRVRQSARMIVATIAVIVAVGSIYCWVRSYVIGEMSYFAGRLGSVEWREDRGYAMICLHDLHSTPNDAATNARLRPFYFGGRDDAYRMTLRFPILKWDFESRRHFGFGADRRDVERYFDDQGNFAMRATAVRAPFWFPTLLGLLTAFLSLRALRRDRYAISPTRCRTCGYDLRAGHDKCPECGTASHVPAKTVVQ